MSGFLQLWAFLIIRSLKSQVFYDSGVLCVLKHNSFKRTQLPTLASNNNTYITLKFKIKWKFGGHIFGHIFWIFQTNISQWMQSTRYLKQMGMIAGVIPAEFKSVKNLYFWELFLAIFSELHRLSYPFVWGISWIAFTVKYFFEKSVIQKIWPKMWPPNFHLISNFNL